jgi:hypothetical protein
MDPSDDRELSHLLREWKAPAAPPTLLERIRSERIRRGEPSSGAEAVAKAAGPPVTWWRWVLAGTIRVPVPVAVAVALLFAIWAYTQLPAAAPRVAPEPTVSLADFEPVQQLEPRVVGEFK